MKVCILIIPKNIINTQRGPVVGVRLNRLQNLTETLGKSMILLHITVTILADVMKQEGLLYGILRFLSKHHMNSLSTVCEFVCVADEAGKYYSLS